MKITKNSDEIIIRHVPVKEWIIGGIFAFFTTVFCVFLLYAFFVAPRGYYESLIGGWTNLISVLSVLIVFITLIVEIKSIRTPLTTVVVNVKNSSIDITRQRVYSTKTEKFYFYQILKFKSYKDKINFSQKYFLALVLANKKIVKLKIPIGDDQQNTVKFIKKLNKFIKRQNVSIQTTLK